MAEEAERQRIAEAKKAEQDAALKRLCALSALDRSFIMDLAKRVGSQLLALPRVVSMCWQEQVSLACSNCTGCEAPGHFPLRPPRRGKPVRKTGGCLLFLREPGRA